MSALAATSSSATRAAALASVALIAIGSDRLLSVDDVFFSECVVVQSWVGSDLGILCSYIHIGCLDKCTEQFATRLE